MFRPAYRSAKCPGRAAGVSRSNRLAGMLGDWRQSQACRPRPRTQQVQWMPLTRAPGKYTLHADGIYFPDADGRFEVICRIDLQTLSQSCKTIGGIGPTEI
jgi:hypothetical protein